eukprot:GILJ01000602.1.p1 GENE.GILJ01000602.1~~GILJ01000602.1.p1  ORF type:complete len:622 (-),score=33.94 GILJ01000602.1:114-1979(-)
MASLFSRLTCCVLLLGLLQLTQTRTVEGNDADNGLPFDVSISREDSGNQAASSLFLQTADTRRVGVSVTVESEKAGNHVDYDASAIPEGFSNISWSSHREHAGECDRGCKHGGICVGENVCKCASGWTGPDCGEDINECEIHNGGCVGNSTCANGPGYHWCICNEGYMDDHRTGSRGDGSHCVPACHNACQNGGVCISPDFCHCAFGFTGKDCSQNFDFCAANETLCGDSGICANTHGSYVCRCQEGWDWLADDNATSPSEGHCELVAHVCDHCVANVSRCARRNGQYRCECHDGYEGDGVSSCTPICEQCANGGVCVLPGQCSCIPGWGGPRCLTPMCEAPCANGGLCIAPDHCRCRFGWVGHDCTTPVCALGCANGGVCVAPPNTCDCADGWSGITCSTAQSGCALHQCHPTRGICQPTGPKEYDCKCKEGFNGDGKKCEVVAQMQATNAVTSAQAIVVHFHVPEAHSPHDYVTLIPGAESKPDMWDMTAISRRDIGIAIDGKLSFITSDRLDNIYKSYRAVYLAFEDTTKAYHMAGYSDIIHILDGPITHPNEIQQAPSAIYHPASTPATLPLQPKFKRLLTAEQITAIKRANIMSKQLYNDRWHWNQKSANKNEEKQ